MLTLQRRINFNQVLNTLLVLPALYLILTLFSMSHYKPISIVKMVQYDTPRFNNNLNK